ncbi:hypothetical protein [Streptomyces sp. NPDC041003]|uniref:hypothetical protein n=1 Tax=Streptomyces sp. NPDC041003 TaxID=3155730 RepID=UPI0033EA1B51
MTAASQLNSSLPATPAPPLADDYAALQRAQGTEARAVMDLATDQFLVVIDITIQ